MTIKEYIRKKGWQRECDSKVCRAMSVDIGFLNDKRQHDETQFDIRAYDVDELSQLFSEFCNENGFRKNTVTNITIVKMADKMEKLA